MSTPLDVVFKTPELLEQIFLAADMKTVLLIQRVCFSWHDLINNSPEIQKHLFFRPDFGRKDKTINPLLLEFFPQWFTGPRDRTKDSFTWADLLSLPLYRHEYNAAFIHEHASWRRMLPRQPPLQSFKRCRWITGEVWRGFTLDSLCAGDATFSGTSKEKEDPDLPCRTPMQMESLYHLATQCGDDNWLFIWDDQGQNYSIPRELGRARLSEKTRNIMKTALTKDGVVMFQSTQVVSTSTDYWYWTFMLRGTNNRARTEQLSSWLADEDVM